MLTLLSNQINVYQVVFFLQDIRLNFVCISHYSLVLHKKKSLNTGAVCKQNDSVTRLLNSQTTYEMILFNGQLWFTVFKQPFVLDGFTCDSHTCKVLLDMRIRFDALWMNITTFTVGIHAKKLGQG